MKKLFWIVSLVMLSSLAQAHVGLHDHHSFMDGVVHPFGFDHLLAMVAVGLWSARAMHGKAQLLGPVLFVLSLVAGAVAAHLSGIEWASAEYLIAASVIAFAVLILFPKTPVPLGFVLIVLAGLVHGWAHGAEAQEGGVFALYVSGFTLTTLVLHLLGIALGRQLVKIQSSWHWRTVSASMAAYGLYALGTL